MKSPLDPCIKGFALVVKATVKNIKININFIIVD